MHRGSGRGRLFFVFFTHSLSFLTGSSYSRNSSQWQRRRVVNSERSLLDAAYPVSCPRGLMDKASVSEAEDCGFESRRG